ncbi:MAG: lasso peptide biosynthesis B2 protein, partial [Bacteroidetes bacterium]|nr:lasso peptide biosynthesis B2 protein [Bacteroidota bacterium]
MKYLYKFLQIPKDEKILFIEAVFFLFLSKGVLMLFPFRYCIKFLKPAEKMTSISNTDFLIKIRQAVSRANKFAYWKNICLVKSFTARLMLQRRNIGSVMYLGLQFKNGRELIAHAWLISGECYITPKGR